MILTKARELFFVLSAAFCANVNAGAYFFAGEANGVDVITHPIGYTSSHAGPLTLRVCIDPASLNATDMEFSVQNNIAAYNQLLPTQNNLKSGSKNNIPANFVDFESVALHEIGHCLGMAHINAASESGAVGGDQNYTKATNGTNGFDFNAGADGIKGSNDDIRGDDENLVWFRKSNNNPFTIDTVIDSTTYSRALGNNLPTNHLFAANADRAVGVALGVSKTEAVMQQGTFFDEAQRTLGHDDVATLRYASSGINELENDPNNPNAQDNYDIVLEYGGISSANCDISLVINNTAGLASCSVGATFIAAGHLTVTSANIQFGDGFNWFFNAANAAPVLNLVGDLSLLSSESLVVNIFASDIDTGLLSFAVSGLPSFVTFVDNSDGTATLTISPSLSESSSTVVTVTVMDNGEPVLSANEIFDINVILDTDGDGLSDNDEINTYGTSPTDPDSDGDGLSDYEEVIVYNTLPNDVDSDGDFINDFDEVNNGGDPLDNTSWPNFADGDLAPLGALDGVINAADLLIAQRITLGELTATPLELSHGDLYPAGSPDGVINASDLILLIPLVQQ